MKRRQFIRMTSLTPFLTSCGWSESTPSSLPATTTGMDSLSKKLKAEVTSVKAHQNLITMKGIKMVGHEHIALLLYPGFTALDLVAPQYIFASMLGAKVYLVSPTHDLTPVMSDTGLTIVPDMPRHKCPNNLDLLCLPGSGSGMLKALQNQSFIDFIKTKAATAKYVASVGSGSLLLGKAGLLKDKRATSHWMTLDLLAKFGATPVKERVVWDGKVITSAGVSAGLDFGLDIIAALRGEQYAKAIQLQMEYAPEPPFASGSPEQAEAPVKEILKGLFEPLHVDLELDL